MAQVQEQRVPAVRVDERNALHHLDPRAVEAVHHHDRPAGGCDRHPPALELDPVRGAQRHLLVRELERSRREVGVLLVGELEAPRGGEPGEPVGHEAQDERPGRRATTVIATLFSQTRHIEPAPPWEVAHDSRNGTQKGGGAEGSTRRPRPGTALGAVDRSRRAVTPSTASRSPVLPLSTLRRAVVSSRRVKGCHGPLEQGLESHTTRPSLAPRPLLGVDRGHPNAWLARGAARESGHEVALGFAGADGLERCRDARRPRQRRSTCSRSAGRRRTSRARARPGAARRGPTRPRAPLVSWPSGVQPPERTRAAPGPRAAARPRTARARASDSRWRWPAPRAPRALERAAAGRVRPGSARGGRSPRAAWPAERRVRGGSGRRPTRARARGPRGAVGRGHPPRAAALRLRRRSATRDREGAPRRAAGSRAPRSPLPRPRTTRSPGQGDAASATSDPSAAASGGRPAWRGARRDPRAGAQRPPRRRRARPFPGRRP